MYYVKQHYKNRFQFPVFSECGLYRGYLLYVDDMRIWFKKKYNCSVLSVASHIKASHIKNYYNKILIVKNALILNLTITIRVKNIISNTKQRLCQKS